MSRSLQALGRLKTGEMNKAEAAYMEYLKDRQFVGHIAWFKFEGIKLRLADNTFYTPDFAVMAADGVMECHEVKGLWQDDARAKIKCFQCPALSNQPLKGRQFLGRGKAELVGAA